MTPANRYLPRLRHAQSPDRAPVDAWGTAFDQLDDPRRLDASDLDDQLTNDLDRG